MWEDVFVHFETDPPWCICYKSQNVSKTTVSKIVQSALERYNTDRKTVYTIDDFNVFTIDQNDEIVDMETNLERQFGDQHQELLLRFKNSNSDFEEEEEYDMCLSIPEDLQISLHKTAELLLKNHNFVQSLSTFRLTSLPPSREAIKLFFENNLAKRYKTDAQYKSVNPFALVSFDRLISELESLFPAEKKGDLLIEVIKRNSNIGIECLLQDPELFVLISKLSKEIPDISTKIVNKIREANIKSNGVVAILSIIAKSNAFDIYCDILTKCVTVSDLSHKSCYEIVWILYQYRRFDILIPIVGHWLLEINDRVDESLHVCLIHGALGLICSFPVFDDGSMNALPKKPFDYTKLDEVEIYTIRIALVGALAIYEEGFLGAFSAVYDAMKNIVDVGDHFLKDFPEWCIFLIAKRCSMRANFSPRFTPSVFVIGDEYSIHTNYRIMKPFGTIFSHSIHGLSYLSLRTQTVQKDMFTYVLKNIQPFDVIMLFIGTVDIEREIPRMLQEGDAESVVGQLVEFAEICASTVDELQYKFPDKKIYVHKILPISANSVNLVNCFNEKIKEQIGNAATFVELDLPPLYKNFENRDLADDFSDKYGKVFFSEYSENKPVKRK